jgi:predicted AAA+ superfamily ATPase
VDLHLKEQSKIKEWFNSSSNEALLVWGLPGVGKTFLVNETIKRNNLAYRYFDFKSDPRWNDFFRSPMPIKDLVLSLSTIPFSGLAGRGLYVFDGIDCCPEVISKIKALIQATDYRFILICTDYPSLIRKAQFIPVGFLRPLLVRPSSFAEFLGLSKGNSHYLEGKCRDSLEKGSPLDPAIHFALSSAFDNFLAVGGFPEAMRAFIEEKDLEKVKICQCQQIQKIWNGIRPYISSPRKTEAIVKAIANGSLSSAYGRFVPSRELDGSRTSRILKNINELSEIEIVHYLPIWDGVFCNSEKRKANPLFALYFADPSFFYGSSPSKLMGTRDELLTRSLLLEAFVFDELLRSSLPVRRFAVRNEALDFVFAQNGKTYLVDLKIMPVYLQFRGLERVLSQSGSESAVGIAMSPANNFAKNSNFRYLPFYALPFFLEND